MRRTTHKEATGCTTYGLRTERVSLTKRNGCSPTLVCIAHAAKLLERIQWLRTSRRILAHHRPHSGESPSSARATPPRQQSIGQVGRHAAIHAFFLQSWAAAVHAAEMPPTQLPVGGRLGKSAVCSFSKLNSPSSVFSGGAKRSHPAPPARNAIPSQPRTGGDAGSSTTPTRMVNSGARRKRAVIREAPRRRISQKSKNRAGKSIKSSPRS